MGKRAVGRPASLELGRILDVVEEVGLDSFTVTEVARRLEVRDSTIYNYVRSREALRVLAGARVLSSLEVTAPEVADWTEYLITVNLRLRRIAQRHRGAAAYYLSGPYDEQTLEMFDGQIAQTRQRLPGIDEDYAFVLASHASTTNLLYLSSPEIGEDTVRAVLGATLPALHGALRGQALPGVSWRQRRDAGRAR
ncbi:hypothetical protein GCM10010174_38580 [Kutzneria viridogrisea]|uniref:Uncharacterized protein n=2 Tax=Kutzneria TaxID=43356 RepID=W5W7F2_9PSEU|nr:TetR family transcriptional regulator [Kutzneria albida]AHH97093.1 hypothetical protein KALB_3729 [Kutzneria albida DSM 43870]MBA8931936.1 AcrR family transcriptional regulator [Kutzneria viridogrisea]